MSSPRQEESGMKHDVLHKRGIVVMILLTLITLGFYLGVWFLRRRKALNQLDSPRKLSLWPFITLIGIQALNLIWSVGTASRKPDLIDAVLGLSRLAIGVVILIQCFFVKDILEDHLAGPDDVVPTGFGQTRVQLSSLLTFFFTIFYLQYVINTKVLQPAEAVMRT